MRIHTASKAPFLFAVTALVSFFMIAPMLLSFMSESRRLVNERAKRELRLRLAWPTPQALLATVAPRSLTRQLPLQL